ncbi:LacI family transcriptional regulator [Mycetocola sp. CAN_C7]|uniref:LacI family DNA-binding transcriptional regulator n=1 Tax=Mycetocola sp. CAN_C7 TaxID=2787724 RepID=UPI0018CA6AEE
MKAPKSKPLLTTVAALAGVSAPTVSKVVNGRADVSATTRLRVQAALDELGYTSPMQRRMRSGGPAMVDLVIADHDGAYSMEVLRGILDHAETVGVDIVVSSHTPNKLARVDHHDWAQRMTDSGRSGVIFVTSEMTAGQLRAFQQRDIAVLVIDPLNPPPGGYASVGATNWAGGKSATEHLLGLGHDRIAFIGGPAAAECSVARLHGYLAALAGRGIPARQPYVFDGPFSQRSGAICARQALDLENPPTAIFAASDTIALGVLEVARERGLRVPDDLSVVGFDGTPLADQTLPRLTSVAQPLQEMGRAALRAVLALSRGERLDSARTELATELIVRDSTAPLLR